MYFFFLPGETTRFVPYRRQITIKKRTLAGASSTSSFLSSQVVSNQVLSTYECLTTVFGMGTGGSTQLSPLDFVKVFVAPSKLYRRQEHFRWQNSGQALGVLVRIGCTPCSASTPRLSTSSSLRRLTGFLREKLHLRAGFTLRCFQRLSFPDAATQLHGWRHDWYTVGPSTPVLSY